MNFQITISFAILFSRVVSILGPHHNIWSPILEQRRLGTIHENNKYLGFANLAQLNHDYNSLRFLPIEPLDLGNGVVKQPKKVVFGTDAGLIEGKRYPEKPAEGINNSSEQVMSTDAVNEQNGVHTGPAKKIIASKNDKDRALAQKHKVQPGKANGTDAGEIAEKEKRLKFDQKKIKKKQVLADRHEKKLKRQEKVLLMLENLIPLTTVPVNGVNVGNDIDKDTVVSKFQQSVLKMKLDHVIKTGKLNTEDSDNIVDTIGKLAPFQIM